MVVYRFMSFEEWRKMEFGAQLRNNTDHSKVRGTASDAYGFCFGIGDKDKALEDLRRLRGVISIEVLVWGELAKGVRLNPCKGRYPDYEVFEKMGKPVSELIGMDMPHKFYHELCASSYSRRTFKWYKHIEYPDPLTSEIAKAMTENPLYLELYRRHVGNRIMGEMERYARFNMESLLRK